MTCQPLIAKGEGRATRSAFTLIELLVVMGIIGILMSMFLPVLVSSKIAAKRVQCLNNLRQLALAAQEYTGDHSDYYPIAQYMDWDTGTQYSWDFTISYDDAGNSSVTPGILWEGAGNAKIQQCPSFDGSPDANNPYTGYNYNTSYIGHGEGEAVKLPARTADVGQTAKTVLFGDGQYSSGADKFMRAPFLNPGDNFSGRWSGTQGFRHQKRSNVAYCDGHTASLFNCYSNNADGARFVAPGTGFLSADNSAYDLN